MTEKEKLMGEWEMNCNNWISRFQSYPKKLVKSGDNSESYDLDRAQVFELEDGRFALVTENGCSCYDSDDADIDLYPDEASAVSKFEEWEKRWKGGNYEKD